MLTKFFFQAAKRNNQTKLQFLRLTQKSSFATSQLQNDLKRVSNVGHTFQPSFEAQRGQYSSQLADFDVSAFESANNLENLAIPVRKEITNSYQREHEFEMAVKERRQNIFETLKDDEVVLTNLPWQLDNTCLASEQKIRKFLEENVHKDLQLISATYLHGIENTHHGARFAYIKLKVGSKRQAHLIQSRLRHYWIDDQLLKIKTSSDARQEIFDNRTIIIRGLPSHWNQKDVIESFAELNNGCFVGLELPMENAKAADFVAEKNRNGLNQENQIKQDGNLKRAQKQIKQALDLDEQFQDRIREEKGTAFLEELVAGDVKHQIDSVEREKMAAQLRIITTLQAENIQVLESKAALQTAQPQGSLTLSEKEFQEHFAPQKEELTRVMHLIKGSELAAPLVAEGGDTLHRLFQFSKGELAHAYDTLIQALSQREQLIEKRLKNQLKHLGIEERILFEKKNWAVELEDIQSPEILGKLIKPEDILSINDQVAFVMNQKNLSAEEKVLALLKRTLNPFRKVNWDPSHLRHADHPELHKYTEIHNFFRFNKTFLKMNRQGSEFAKGSRKIIDNLVEEYRGRYDLPFDELYHKEKGLVRAVVEAHKALKQKEALLKPYHVNNMIDKAELQHLQKESILNDAHESSVFSQVQQKLHARLQKDGIDTSQLGSLSYLNSKQSELDKLLKQGIVTQSDIDLLKQMARSLEHRNLGYCFLTFSHSDEARLMLMRNPRPYINHQKLQIDLKSKIDHGDLDLQHFYQKAKNDSLVMGELEQLRKARQELREFEDSHESHFPSHLKLKEFRELAKDVIEGGVASKARGQRRGNRSHFENERLMKKIEELEKKYPHIDVTQLFMSDKSDRAQKAIHKAAFASYKANEFLKHGVKSDQESSQKLSAAKQRLEESDPFNFPEMDATVAKILSNDAVQPRINDHGDFLKRSGRRFGRMSDQDFLESFFGKDNMRNAVTSAEDDPLYVEQKSLKERFPLSMFLKGPSIEKKKQQVRDLGFHPDYKSIEWDRYGEVVMKSSDPEIAAVQELMDRGQREGHFLRDRIHPTKENRTMLTDMEKILTQYEDTVDKIEDDEGQQYPILDFKQLSKIRRAIKNEYQPKKDDKWLRDLKEGKWQRPKITEQEDATDEQNAAKFNNQKENKADEENFTVDEYSSESDAFDEYIDNFNRSSINYDQIPKKLQPTAYESAEEFEGTGKNKRLRSHFEKYREWQISEDLKEQQAREHLNKIDNDYNNQMARQMQKQRLSQFRQEDLPQDQVRKSKAPHYFDAKDVDESTQRVNQEYVYNQRLNENFDPTQEREQIANQNEMDAFELLQNMSQKAHMREAGKQYGGDFTKAFEGGEIRESKFQQKHPQNAARSLESFITKQQEEEDVYQMYQQKINERAYNKIEENALPQIDQQTFDAQMPRLEEYMNYEKDQIHPFDKISNKVEEDLQNMPKDEYDDWDREMYSREIMGRLVGKKLTPRQFDILKGQYSSDQAKLQWVKDANNNLFLERRHMIQVATEGLEQHRRQKVQKGEWTEQESHQKIYDKLQEIVQQIPGPEQQKKIQRFQEVVIDTMLKMETPEKIFEKEYHFDEGLGQTLDQHVQELKQQYPGIRVQTRRDRDGFPIIKTLFKKEYKYDINQLENFDQEKELEKMNSALETILDAAYPGSAQEALTQMTTNLSEVVTNVNQRGIDSWTKLKIQELCQKHQKGQVNNQELAAQFLEIASEAQTSSQSTEELDAFKSLMSDQQRFTHEIHEQLALRMKHFLTRQERKKSDFIKARADESLSLQGQLDQHAQQLGVLESNVANQEKFDREAFEQMKAEIRERKQAKERLLSQGLPEFEAYLRF